MKRAIKINQISNEIDLLTAFGITKPMVISIVGSGGKTTLMYRLAKELILKNKKVISTTTTKIYPPTLEQSQKLILTARIRAQNIEPLLKKYQHITIAESKNQENKLIGLEPEIIDQLNDKHLKKCKLDYILVEADGAKGKSLKAYRDFEPVIPSSTNLCILVLGWDILGKPLNNRYVHRAKLLSQLINVKINSNISVPILIKSLCIEGGYLSRIPKTCKLIVFINKADFKVDKRRLNLFCQRLIKESPRPIARIIIGSLKTKK